MYKCVFIICFSLRLSVFAFTRQPTKLKSKAFTTDWVVLFLLSLATIFSSRGKKVSK